MENKYTGFLKGRRALYEKREKCPPDGDITVVRFINTLHRRDAEKKEYLNNYDAFLDWAYDEGVIEEAMYNSLCFESYCYWDEAKAVFEMAISFRECFCDLVLHLMEGMVPYDQLISNFNEYFEEVKKHRRLNMNGYGMLEIWVDYNEKEAFPLWKIINAAKDFLTGIDGSIIKRCKCGNLFIDRSNARRRRWCNNATCGNAYWSKEYYRRSKVLAAC